MMAVFQFSFVKVKAWQQFHYSTAYQMNMYITYIHTTKYEILIA